MPSTAATESGLAHWEAIVKSSRFFEHGLDMTDVAKRPLNHRSMRINKEGEGERDFMTPPETAAYHLLNTLDKLPGGVSPPAHALTSASGGGGG